MQAYSDPSRAEDPRALPDVEIFYSSEEMLRDSDLCPVEWDGDVSDYVGFYWQACFPGCLPDGEPVGPFATEAEALEDAQSQD